MRSCTISCVTKIFFVYDFFVIYNPVLNPQWFFKMHVYVNLLMNETWISVKILGSIFAHNATHKTSKGPGYRIPSKGPMAPRLKSGISIWDSQIISSGLYELIFFRIWFAGSLIQAKNPGRQVRLHEQPSPATSYFLFEVVFFDGSTVNLLNFNSPEDFFEAFQVCLKIFTTVFD